MSDSDAREAERRHDRAYRARLIAAGAIGRIGSGARLSALPIWIERRPTLTITPGRPGTAGERHDLATTATPRTT